MPQINLLPWREDLRKERQKNFALAAVTAILVAIGVIFAVNLTMNRKIEHQTARNDLLIMEIAELNKQIEEILGLENQKERLLARMEIIEQLQRSRPEIVHLFDELARTMPEGVYLSSVQQIEKNLTMQGVAQSSTRVSAYMRNIDGSAWLTKPALDVIATVSVGTGRNAEFKVRAQQVVTVDEEEGALN